LQSDSRRKLLQGYGGGDGVKEYDYDYGHPYGAPLGQL
jgi:hypothetical protein